jgi:hypothetical protein
MLNWLKRYWAALILSALMLAMFDAVISSLITCHPIGANSGSGANSQKDQQCTALAGPIFLTLVGFLTFLDTHGEAVVGVFTIVLATFTGRLWFSTEKLWNVTNESVRIATTEFVSSHRPQMRLKHIWVDNNDLWRGEPIEINLAFVNIGNTTGIITNFNYDTLVLPTGTRLPQRPTYNEENPRITFQFRDQVPLASGITYARTFCDGRRFTANEITRIRSSAARLYVVGTIEYWTANQGARQTAFCRYYTGASDRFETEHDPDYEYQD